MSVQQQSDERAQFKKIFARVDANYSSPDFERTLVDQGIQHIQHIQASRIDSGKKTPWTDFLRHFKPVQRTGFVLVSEVVIIMGFVFYLNTSYGPDELAALDLIGEFSLETL
jgi:hypothetical protein